MAVKIFFFVLIMLVACYIDNINGKRGSLGSRFPSSTAHSSRTSNTRTSSYPNKSGNSRGTSHGIPSSGRVSYPRQPSVPNHPPPPIHPSSGTLINRNQPPPSHESTGGTSKSQQNKDASTGMINAEGGRAIRPSHVPSAPPLPGSGNRPFVTDSKQQSSPHAPSAPIEPISRVSAPTQTHGQPTAGTPWGNPHYNPSQPGATGSHNPPPPGFNVNSGSHNPPQSGFNVNTYPHPPTASHPAGVHFPTSHASYPNPPYPTNAPYPPRSFPSAPSQPHYPISPHSSNPGSAPYPPHSMGQPGYMPGVGHQHYPFQPTHGSYPGSSFGNPSYPAPPSIGNPYQSYHPGGFGGGAYPQQPHVLAQPASQPFVPGQTVIMMPGQQDSGRGFGQLVKEALVFSTINAGVNRIINPHHHYVSENRPANSDVSTSTTHITYNNQYFNTLPNGTTVQVEAPPDAPGVGAPNPSHLAGTYNPVYGTGTTMGNAGNALSPGSVIPVPPIVNSQQGNAGANVGVNQNSANVNSNVNASVENEGILSNNNPVMNTVQHRISDEALWKISEELFKKEEFNVSKSVVLNLQNKSASVNVTDTAKERLFYAQPDVYEIPTIRAIRALYDNYERQAGVKENVTLEKRKEQNYFLDVILNTNVMTAAMQWLADNSFIDPDDFERKDVLQHMWFNQYDGSTSGFERIFASEIYGNTSILGVQDWIYFNHQESWGKINYMGHVDKLDLGDKASLVKLNFEMNGIVRPNTTIFVGTMPELEMSLYTICFYARPNDLCPVSLGGTKFNIFTHSFRYFGRDLIDLALPMF